MIHNFFHGFSDVALGNPLKIPSKFRSTAGKIPYEWRFDFPARGYKPSEQCSKPSGDFQFHGL
jgi:hypothetical protein